MRERETRRLQGELKRAQEQAEADMAAVRAEAAEQMNIKKKEVG